MIWIIWAVSFYGIAIWDSVKPTNIAGLKIYLPKNEMLCFKPCINFNVSYQMYLVLCYLCYL